MIRFLALLTMLFCLSGAWVQAETVNRIAAVVNKEIITQYQVDHELEKRQGKDVLGRISPQELGEMRQRALNSLIEETLVRQRVKELDIEVGEDEIEAAIGDVLMQNQLTRDELTEALKLQGMSFDVYRQNLREQILRFKLLGREVKSKVDVTHQEILDYFREHIEDYRQKPMLRLARVSFPLPDKPTSEQVDAIRALAGEARSRLNQGEDFFAVQLAYATEHGAEGGDMGTFAEGELTPAFDRAVKDLAEGQVSELVETPDGLHLFKVISRQAGSVRQFDAVKDEISKTLTEQKTDEAFKTWAEGLRKTAYIDIRQ